jgi:hypothetical protein
MSEENKQAIDHKNNEKLVTVARRPGEAGADVLVSVLADAGIRAVATGGFTSGFQAEAPGWVSVQTLESDAARAREILAEAHEDAVEWLAEDSDDVEETGETG